MGANPIVGGPSISRFSADLTGVLRSKGYFVLSHAMSRTVGGRSTWILAEQLGLIGGLALEWESFVQSLRDLNITLQASADHLV